MERYVKLNSLMIFWLDCIPQLLLGSQGAKGRLVDQMTEEVYFPSKVLVSIVSKVEIKHQSAVEFLRVNHKRSVSVTLA